MDKPNKKYGRYLIRIVSVLASCSLLALLLWKIGAASVYENLTALDWRWLVLALGFATILPFTGTLRWLAVLEPLGARIGFVSALIVTLGAFPLNAFLPSKAGDLSKAAFVRSQSGFVALAGSVVLERMIDVFVLSAIAVFGAVVSGTGRLVWLSLALVGLIVIGILLLRYSNRYPAPTFLKRIAGELGESTRALLHSPKHFVLAALWSLLNWLCTMVVAYCLFNAVYLDLPFHTVISVMPLAIFCGLIPLTISGIGSRDAGLVWLLAGAAPMDKVLAVGVLYTAVNYWYLGLLGLPFLIVSIYLRTKSSQASKQ